MKSITQSKQYTEIIHIITWGTLWGIFEATVGYVLHLLPFSFGWLIWYPAACFFMANLYRKTQKSSSIFFFGLLSASIKLFNLFLPGRIDKVINPAISIAFEALAMATVIFAINHFLKNKEKSLPIKALTAFCMNTGWRLLFILYLLFLVPDWMREISVISSAEKFIPFFIKHNFFTTLILFAGYKYIDYIFLPIKSIERRIADINIPIPPKSIPAFKTAAVILALCVNIALGLFL